jgi:uncharacterized protein YsxB (DUF464 family)
MVYIEINYKGNDIVSFKVKGHTGFAPRGEDIYCAGVSAVAQTILLGLLKNLKTKVKYHIKEGWLECVIPEGIDRDEMDKAQIILSTMEAGMRSMQEAYGEFIKLEVRRS